MRRCGEPLERVIAPGNLWRAWRDFRRGKRNRPSVAAFEARAERNVLELHRDLAHGRYQPGGYRLRLIHEPKRRLIAAADVRDRVVHHAIHRVLAPEVDRRLIDQTYACLPRRGCHRAALHLLGALRRQRFALFLDVRRYFLSIDRAILIDEVMARAVKDRGRLELMRRVANSGAGLYRAPGVAEFLDLEPGFPPAGAGLPIGNLTSQWWGNHYLSGLDHYVKRDLGVAHYQRYMDDFVLLGADRRSLLEARDAIAAWLGQHRRLQLKHPNATPKDAAAGRFDFLGFRVSRAGLAPTRAAMKRMQQKVRDKVLHGDAASVRRSLASYRGLFAFSRVVRPSSTEIDGL